VLIPRKTNRRRRDRTERSILVRVSWRDGNGLERCANALSLDVSELGIRIESREPIAERSYVTLDAEGLALHGTATVRNCTGKGPKFQVGLEFSGGMRWTPMP
jgi:hypothetical protein